MDLQILRAEQRVKSIMVGHELYSWPTITSWPIAHPLTCTGCWEYKIRASAYNNVPHMILQRESLSNHNAPLLVGTD